MAPKGLNSVAQNAGLQTTEKLNRKRKMTSMERAQKLVAETQATYDNQVKAGKYLCDKPMNLDEALRYIKEQDNEEI
jgi:cell division protein YceG involved in septum cleavage